MCVSSISPAVSAAHLAKVNATALEGVAVVMFGELVFINRPLRKEAYITNSA